jgi:GAF domain-containing protein
VLDAGDVQGLLARAAELLSARGVIVWVAGRQGASLYPMFTYGYPAAVLIRLGSISSDARNATAAAWRSGELTAVAGAGDRPGALVTPIVTADGCVGVLAAEIADGREMDGDVRALATIFSAQLATVVTPVAEVSQGDMADRVAT